MKGLHFVASLMLVTNVVAKDFNRPNIVIFFADDVGYGDLHSYGNPLQEKEILDELADEGMRFTQWYSSEAMCSPSRAALLTGRLAARVGVVGMTRTYASNSTQGLPSSELTLAEFLKENGYKTGMVGKWHLGINAHNRTDGSHLPHNHGFDYVGHNLPLSNIIWCKYREGSTTPIIDNDCFLYENHTIVQQPINIATMAPKFVNDAKKFIKDAAADKKNPFFLYFSLSNTHADITTMPEFAGSSKAGFYGDNVREMQWQVQEIMDTLKETKAYWNTLVFFSSDNGAQEDLCREGGSNGPLRGDKGRFFEGGVRVPAIAWWPGVIKAGSVTESVVNTMDVLPTIADIIGVSLPTDRIYDGFSLWQILQGKEEKTDRNLTFFYCSNRLMAVRYNEYKVHYMTMSEFSEQNTPDFCPDGGYPVNPMTKLDRWGCWREEAYVQDPPLIYNLTIDQQERWPINADDPEEVILLQKLADILATHNETIPYPDILQMDSANRYGGVTPCCNEATYPQCSCNYDGTDYHFFVPGW